MEILNFEGSKGSSNKRSKRFMAIASIVAMGFLGSTFAASISLNSGTNIEYGQGVSSATACAGNLTVAPANTYWETTTSFILDAITISDSAGVTSGGVGSTGLGNCINKSITVKALKSDGSSLYSCDLKLTSWATNGGYSSTANTCSNTTLSAYEGGASDGFKVDYTGATLIQAADVAKITLESHN